MTPSLPKVQARILFSQYIYIYRETNNFLSIEFNSTTFIHRLKSLAQAYATEHNKLRQRKLLPPFHVPRKWQDFIRKLNGYKHMHATLGTIS